MNLIILAPDMRTETKEENVCLFSQANFKLFLSEGRHFFDFTNLEVSEIGNLELRMIEAIADEVTLVCRGKLIFPRDSFSRIDFLSLESRPSSAKEIVEFEQWAETFDRDIFFLEPGECVDSKLLKRIMEE